MANYNGMGSTEKGVRSMECKNTEKKPVIVEAYRTERELVIHTLEGDMLTQPGDYIITGVHGEQYPCKPDVFEETYEPVDP